MFWKRSGRNGFLKGVKGILWQIIVWEKKHFRFVSYDLNDELNETVNVLLLKDLPILLFKSPYTVTSNFVFLTARMDSE